MKLEIQKITDDSITVVYLNRKKVIAKADFEKFVEARNLRAWVMDTSDHTGAHIQTTGKASWEEFYDDSWWLMDVIYEYLNRKK